jgi:hypothetical protein
MTVSDDWKRRGVFALVLTTGLFGCFDGGVRAAESSPAQDRIPAESLSRLSSGEPRDLLILLPSAQVEAEAEVLRSRRNLRWDDEEVLALRRSGYHRLRERAMARVLPGEAELVRSYSHLPMALVRFRSAQPLLRLLDVGAVEAVYEDMPLYPTLSQSLPLVGQPTASAAGFGGDGTTVAVIDTGIDYRLAAFGSCTAPGVPSATCRVTASVDVTGNGVTLVTDPANHGTNVAGIVAGTAGKARIAAVNVFASGTTTVSLVIDGINWAIANRAAHNIAALNMSLGDGVNHTSLCSSAATNPFLVPLNNARAAGIQPVASSGNDGYTSGIGLPACTPGVLSVGAVYDANQGGIGWTTCTDSTTAADKVTCFSNSSSFLSLLAPGALITAAGSTKGGTSQAAPHVAGAYAVLKAAFPAETMDQIAARLTSTGTSVTDHRNGIVKPRLNLPAAIGPPVNDPFAARIPLAGPGQITGTTINASREAGEPIHAGNAGGRSAWWSWTPAESGVTIIDTHGSSFDTLLGVYTGTGVAALTTVASNDNDGSAGNTSGLTFTAVAGTTYHVAVDGYSGASGSVRLNLAHELRADLATTLTASPDPVETGAELTFSVSIANHGPSPAASAGALISLPPGSLFVSASPACTELAGIVTCVLGTLAPGATVTVEATVTPVSTGTATASAQATSATTDPDPADNNASVAATVIAPPPAVPALSPAGICAALAGILFGAGRLRRNFH